MCLALIIIEFWKIFRFNSHISIIIIIQTDKENDQYLQGKYPHQFINRLLPYLHTSRNIQLICRLVEYLLSVSEALALMLSIICAQSNETFAFPHKLSTVLRWNECIFVHLLLFKYGSKRSRCLMEHYYLKGFVC